jgi:hypothetical protein
LKFRSRIRQALVEVARRYYRFQVKEIANQLKRSEPAISRIIKRRWEKKEGLEEATQLIAFIAAEVNVKEPKVIGAAAEC